MIKPRSPNSSVRYILLLILVLLTVCQRTTYAQFRYPGLGGFGGGFGGGLGSAGFGLYGYGFGGYPTLGGPQQAPSFGGGYPCYGGYFCGGRYPAGFGGYPFYGNGMNTAFASSSGGGIASASASSGYRGSFFG